MPERRKTEDPAAAPTPGDPDRVDGASTQGTLLTGAASLTTVWTRPRRWVVLPIGFVGLGVTVLGISGIFAIVSEESQVEPLPSRNPAAPLLAPLDKTGRIAATPAITAEDVVDALADPTASLSSSAPAGALPSAPPTAARSAASSPDAPPPAAASAASPVSSKGTSKGTQHRRGPPSVH